MLFCIISDKRNHLLHFLEGQQVLGQSVLVAVLPGYHAMEMVMFDQVTQPVLLHTVDELEKFTANVLALVSVLIPHFLSFCVDLALGVLHHVTTPKTGAQLTQDDEVSCVSFQG